MRKVLALCASMLLFSAATSTIVSCKSSKVNKIDEVNEDYREELNKISAEVKKLLDEKLFKEEFIAENLNALDGIFDKVNAVQKYYTLDTENDSAYINIFKDSYIDVLNQINDEIKTKYSNYYEKSDPLQDLNQLEIKIGFVDIEKIKQEARISNVEGAENLKVVSINFIASYKVLLKDYDTTETINLDFNLPSNPEIYAIFKNKLLQKIQDLMNEFLNNNKKIIISSKKGSLYKQLYDNFDIDYSLEHYNLSRLFKNNFKKYVDSVDELKNLSFEYGENKSFLVKNESIFDNKDPVNCGKFGLWDFFHYCSTDYRDFMPHTWAGNGNSAVLKKLNKVEFWNSYKELVPILKVNGSELLLAKFKLDMSYVRLHGLNLDGLAKNDNDKDFEIEVTISKHDLEAKVQEFLDFIIKFYKAYETNFSRSEYVFKVNKKVFDRITKESDKSIKQVIEILMDEFKKENGQLLGNSKNIIFAKSTLLETLVYDEIDSRNLIYRYGKGGWDLTFTFNNIIRFTSASYLAPYFKITLNE